MKIDTYAHICPPKFIDAFNKQGGNWEKAGVTASLIGGPALWDTDKRLEVMDRYEDYVQVLVPTIELVEAFFSPEVTPGLVKILNDELAELISKYPKKFVAAVATISMNNVDAALKEIDRAINELGFKGILMHTPVFSYAEGRPRELGLNYDNVKAIDSSEFMPIYEAMSKHNLPIWIHPCGYGGTPIYSGENRGKYQLAHAFGWPIESAMAMSRLVCSGILSKYPNLRFIIHHCGSGIVPALADRIDNELEEYSSTGVIKWNELGVENPFQTKRPVDYFKMFYADTATDGGRVGLECGHAFFGAEHILFGTDYPYDLANGDKFINKTIDAVHKMNISDTDKGLIFEGNIKRILHLDI